jgi:hypothetical protein
MVPALLDRKSERRGRLTIHRIQRARRSQITHCRVGSFPGRARWRLPVQILRAPASNAGQASRPIVVPGNGNTYVLDGQGRLLAQESDLPWFYSQGYSSVTDIIADLFAASGVIPSGTSSVAMGILPPNFYIESLIFQNLIASAITGGINVGSTAGGNDIVSALAIGANALLVATDAVILKRVFSTTAPTSLFVSAVTSWNGANLNAKAVLRAF